MSFICKICKTKSEKTALDKVMESGTIELSGTLLNDTDIINPSIIVHAGAETLASYNYMEIGSFNRKYFITEITALNHDTAVIKGHVDVLSTYKDAIRKNMAIVGRSETKYNMYIDDNTLKTDARPVIQTLNNFNGGYFSDAGSICLVVVG